MINTSDVLRRFTEQIEVKYLRAARQGNTDIAVIVDTTNQEHLRRTVAVQRGQPGTAVDAFVGVTGFP